MIIVHTVQGSEARRVELQCGDPLPEGAVWVDLLKPTVEEEKAIERTMGLDVPTREETRRNEILGRTYAREGATYLATQVTIHTNTTLPEATEVIFIHTAECLITVRYEEMTSFTHFSKQLLAHPTEFTDGERVLLGLLHERVWRVADICGLSLETLDNLSHRIFNTQEAVSHNAPMSARDYDEILKMLGRRADLIGKLHESLQSLFRAVSYFEKTQDTALRYPAQVKRLKIELQALVEETVFLSNKIAFLLDATLGFINVQQNAIIKIFSVAAVMLMPATLVASVYGMNFQHIPELAWDYGYPMALTLMALSGILPYQYFKKRKWL